MMKRKKIQVFLFKLIRDLLILVLIGNVLALFIHPLENWSLQIMLQNCLFSVGIGYPAWKGMDYITRVLEKRLPWLKRPIKRLIYQVLAMTLYFLVIIILGMSFWIAVVESQKLASVIEYVTPSLGVVYIFMFLSLLFGNALLFFKNWKASAIQQEELKRAHLALQYQSLKDQIKPHFLFNSLSSLTTLINTDTDKATQFVHKLSDAYRYLLDQRENELVSLEEEVRFVWDYIYLQQIRFGENLQIHWKLDLDDQRLIIPLSLQLLVENALKHNVISKEYPLHVEIYSTPDGHIWVKNKVRKKDSSGRSMGMGLENLQKQVAFYSDEDLKIIENDGEFIVRIPTLPAKSPKE